MSILYINMPNKNGGKSTKLTGKNKKKKGGELSPEDIEFIKKQKNDLKIAKEYALNMSGGKKKK